MKRFALLALFIVLGIQLLLVGVQTHLALNNQSLEQGKQGPFNKDEGRRPSSIKELPEAGPIQELKYEILPNEYPWERGSV